MIWFNKKKIGAGYLTRWHLIPRNRFFNIYLHKFTGNDDTRALHDHPWNSVSVRLKGGLNEFFNDKRVYEKDAFSVQADVEGRLFVRDAPCICFRKATFAHRLEIVKNKPAWTLFITGPVIREWGFHCRKGWQHWSTMTTKEGKAIGGCE